MQRSVKVRIGVGGWSYAPWRGVFYPKNLPQQRELEFASRQLTSIEINSTFYGPQKPATFAKWRDATPPDFVFAVKAPRFATVRRNLAEAGESIERFLRGGVMELGDRLGPINWQLAPAKQFDAREIEAFFALLPEKIGKRPLRHAIEVRHPSFADQAFIELARQHGVAIVLAGDSQYPQIETRTAPFLYARIMGTKARPKAGYTPAALDTWAGRIAGWTAERTLNAGFVYVISGHKVRNPAAAVALLERMRA
jgi:uncharacterized protein YecE (DUF72 family)